MEDTVAGTAEGGVITGADLPPAPFSADCSLRLTITGAAHITGRAPATLTDLLGGTR
jgi:hypothetical protein